MDTLETLKGTGVALITPFDEAGDIDYDAMKKHIEHLLKNGIDYFVVLGTTGESVTLKKFEKISLIEFVSKTLANRKPLIVGHGGNYTQQIIDDMRELPLHLAYAILSVSPYYNKPSQEGLYQHYLALANAAPKPLILYNVPGRTGRNMEPSTTLRLAEHKNIIGIKEAVNGLPQCIKLLRDKPKHFLVVSGDDDLILPQMACGMHGVISVAANGFSESFTKMINYCLANDFKSAAAINNTLIEAYDLIFRENNPAGIKAVLHLQGFIKNKLRLPLTPVSKGLYAEIANYVNNHKS